MEAATAVAAGRRPTTTAECDADVVVRPRVVNNGKPRTTPKEITVSRAH